jgi:hypothetical protein
MKANDKDVPADEMLLAEALAAANALGLRFCTGSRFRPYGAVLGDPGRPSPTACCVMGALEIAGKPLMPIEFEDAWIGNDSDGGEWEDCKEDSGVSLGWAFRCAMTQETE